MLGVIPIGILPWASPSNVPLTFFADKCIRTWMLDCICAFYPLAPYGPPLWIFVDLGWQIFWDFRLKPCGPQKKLYSY